jgi:hypothetical protein
VSGRQLVARDAHGFVLCAGSEVACGMVSPTEKLVTRGSSGHGAFGMHALLDSIAAPSDYPLPQPLDVPRSALITAPKSFQLQAREQ